MASDYALAIKLSQQHDITERPLSIVDASWDLIDPLPNIRELFIQYDGEFFDGLLASVEVKWSSRMTLCAGLCCYEGRGGLCTIKLSEPLLKLRPRKDLVETLLHEMIHALLFVTQNNKDHDGHGPEFHKHMYRINRRAGTSISVYHSFHDEVNNYRQHWWKCDGPCVKRPPYYGIVRRAMNRPPSPHDPWWLEHMRRCGGTFAKIKEPENYKKKNSKKSNKMCTKLVSSTKSSKENMMANWLLSRPKTSPIKGITNNTKPFGNNALQKASSNDFTSITTTSNPKPLDSFGGLGYITGTSVNNTDGREAFLKSLEMKMCKNRKRKLHDTTSTDEVISIRDEIFVECPACPVKVAKHLLNSHLDDCLRS